MEEQVARFRDTARPNSGIRDWPPYDRADAADPAGQLAPWALAFAATTRAPTAFSAVLAGALRTRLLGSVAAMAWLRRAFAACFAGLAARLAMERA